MNTVPPQRRYSPTTTTLSRFFFTFFSVLFFTFTAANHHRVHDDDAFYMSKLLKALTPTPTGWSNNTDFCKWNGVACNEYGRVSAIKLPSSSLSGTLPSDLNTLSNLTHIDLHNNSLTGLLPDLSNLPYLTHIDLHNNSLTGPLSNLPSLTRIDLHNNSLGGPLPYLVGLYSLTHIDLHNNSLTGPLPSLSNLDTLQYAYLGHNNFTSIPAGCFSSLTDLRALNLSNNLNLTQWEFPAEDLISSGSLQTLDLEATNMMGPLPPGMFEGFPSLETVFLSDNEFTGTLPQSLWNSSIRYLRLNNNNELSGTIEVISSMRNLSQAWLNNNDFDGSIPDLSHCTHLFDLQLHSNRLAGVVPPSLMALPSLNHVSLDDNGLQGPLPEFRKGVKATWENNYFCNGPCDPLVTILLEIAAAFGHPLKLGYSWIGENDPCADLEYVGCTRGKLVTVNLEELNLTGTISPAFANLTGLVNLTLSGNNLTGSIPPSLTTLSQLKFLDVSNNNLSGQVPKFPPKVKLNTTGNALLLGGSPSKKTLWILAGASMFSVGAAVILVVICCKHKRYLSLLQKRIFNKTTLLDNNVEDVIRNYNLSVAKRYSYAEVKRITNSFRDKLGQGGYGVVYKASLPDGRQVAVKVIKEAKGNGEEFINEVASISRTSHVNIVSLLGFCYELNKRALIYEFMPNGSLDKFIYRSGFSSAICNLDWNTLYQIVIGIARGLEYLHQGCISRILHLDIKPQNILLDEDFCPKISDFGLAKICQKKESIVSIPGTRGTIGYMAPEIFSRAFGRVSQKSDVYSYGMLILEIIGGRENHDTGGSHATEMYFPDWIYNDLEQGNTLVNWLAISDEENDMVRKITMVSLWCIQTNPSDRPSMKKVIEMLEGPLQSVPFPPKPVLYSPERPPLQISYMSSSNLYETNSITTQKNGSIESNELKKDEK